MDVILSHISICTDPIIWTSYREWSVDIVINVMPAGWHINEIIQVVEVIL